MSWTSINARRSAREWWCSRLARQPQPAFMKDRAADTRDEPLSASAVGGSPVRYARDVVGAHSRRSRRTSPTKLTRPDRGAEGRGCGFRARQTLLGEYGWRSDGLARM